MTDDRQKKNAELVRREVVVHGKRITGLEGRVDGVEERVEGLNDSPTEPRLVPSVPRPTPRSNRAVPPPVPGTRAAELGAMRPVSESKLELKETVGAMTAHLEKVRQAQAERDADFARALAVVARDQGLVHELPARIAASLPPPAPKRTPLRRIDRRTLAGLLVTCLFTLIEIEALLERIVDRIEHAATHQPSRSP